MIAALLAGWPGALGHAATSPWAVTEHSRVRLVTPYAVGPATGPFELGLHFRLVPDWHVYWKNSGDAGFPPWLGFDATPELEEATLHWPAPHRYELPGDLLAFGYGPEVVYPVTAEVHSRAEETIEIRAEVDYLVCKVDCVPYRHELVLSQPVGSQIAPDPLAAALIESWRLQVPKSAAALDGVETSGRILAGEDGSLELRIDVRAPAVDADRLDLFLEDHDLFAAGRPRMTIDEVKGAPGDPAMAIRLRIPLERRDRRQQLPETTELEWTVTGLISPADAPVALAERREIPVAGPESPGAGEAKGIRAGSSFNASPGEAPRSDGGTSVDDQVSTVLWTVCTGLAFLFLSLHLWLGGGTKPPAWRQGLGFLTAGLLVWILYRLAPVLPATEVAALELGFLGVGLLATFRYRARPGSGRRAMLTLLLVVACALTLLLVWGGPVEAGPVPSLQ